eukprot:c15492_g1_i1.p1 GENE.c15492_g1_i1~~c15492_g1_i1.p1  ORF type:complete len:251 (-),score=99.96 c15492_g1_i1:55-771(-)
MSTKVEFFFDVISPYTLLAWKVLRRYETRWSLDIQLKPIFLGGVMQLTGNKPPAVLPPKAKFQADDLRRNSELFNVPLLPTPPNFFTEVARNSVRLQRVILAAQLSGLPNTQVHRLVDTFIDAVHSDQTKRTAGNDLIIDEKMIYQCLISIGLSVDNSKQLIQVSSSEDTKAKLKSETEFAVKKGVYGSPTMIIHPVDEKSKEEGPFLVFGSDRFEQIGFLLHKKWEGPNPSTTNSKL